MKYQVIQPPANLAQYVRYFWILEGDQPYKHRSLADGCVEMIFHYQGVFDELRANGREKCALSVIQGASRNYQEYSCSTSFGIFGVYFYPYSIPVLFGMPSCELSNQMPNLNAVIGNEGTFLEEQIMEARSHWQRIEVINNFLQKKLMNVSASEKLYQQVIKSIILSEIPFDIEHLSYKCSVSRRQFERKFKDQAGFSPKQYYRIIRFQQATNEYNKADKTLAQIALDCGYYDQSHFTNDFVRFSGYKPKDFFSGKVIGSEWRDC